MCAEATFEFGKTSSQTNFTEYQQSLMGHMSESDKTFDNDNFGDALNQVTMIESGGFSVALF